MSLNIKDLINRATAIRDEVQAAIAEGEHIAETVKGDIATGQLVTAAGAASTLLTNLQNHEAAIANALKSGGDAAPATPTAPAASAAAQ